MSLEVESHLFPIPDSQYARSGFNDPLVALSILALTIQIVTQPGNLLKDQDGSFFFRDSNIPRVRPCTYLAWNRICRLGRIQSKTFIVPFLPSLREEDEVGSAIGERGIRLPSLSRRNKHHLRDSKQRITWGNIYIGELNDSGTLDNILTGVLDRSNVNESAIVPTRDYESSSLNSSIRERMEFLASHGILAVAQSDSGLPPLVRIRRLLFQSSTQSAAAQWALSYNESAMALARDSRSIVNADYKDMMHDLVNRERKKVDDSLESDLDGQVKNNSKTGGRFDLGLL